MIISGNLDETSIVDAFQLIGSSRRTGILRASQKDGEIRIYWKSGSIVYAESGKGDTSLQMRLVSTLGPERWHRALRESGGTLASATSRLVADGALAADGLKTLAEECSRAAIDELFSWSEGGFEFSEGAFPDADIVPVTLHTPSLIVEGSRRVGRLAELRAAIPDRHIVFRLASLPDESLRSIRLGSEEWATLSLINGHRSVEEICRLASGDELRTLQALYGLLSAGLIVELERAEDDDSGKLELGRVKYSRILEVYCELHTMLMDRLLEAPPAAVMPPLRQAFAKLAKAYPKVWAGIAPTPERELSGAQFVGNILKVPAEQRTPLMMQAFGHLLLKETLVLRHVLGDDAAQMAITDLRMLLQRGEKRYPEVSSKILRHLRDVLRQAEQIPSRYKMGFDFFEKHRYDEAIRLWKSVPPTNPQYRAVQDLINQAYQLTAGRSQLRLALERGEHLYSEGRYEEAVDVWKGAVTADADAADVVEHETTRKTLVQRLEEMGRVSVLLGEARSLVQERRFDDARSLLDQALGIAPDLPEAVELLQDVTARADKMATLREQVFEGLELYRTERYGEAIEVFRRVLALDPRHQLAGDHLRFSQDRLAAILDGRPQYAAAREASRAGDHFRAVELWEDLLQKSSNDDVASYFLRQEREALQSQRLFHEAMTFYLDKNFVRATELLNRCLEEHPGHAEALHLLEQCKNRLAQLDHAQGLLREASRHFEAGQVPEAQRAVERLLEIDPQSRPARLAQAQLQQAMEEERNTGRFTGSSLVSRVAEERPTATVRVLPDTAPSQLLDEIIAEEAETPTAQIGPSRPGAPLMSAEEDEPPTPDMRDFAREAKKLDEDVTRSFKRPSK